MKQRLFKPRDGRRAISVSSIDEIREYMGEIMDYGLGNIEVIDNLVVTYMDRTPITLGTLT